MYMVNFTSDDFNKNIKKSNIALIPIGSLEAHGHHLPLGTDMFAPRLFAKKIDEKIGDEIWIAPEIPYGQCFDMSVYPGTVSVPTEIMSSYIYSVGKSMHENGIKKIIFLNGHGGNMTALNLASEKLVLLGMDILTINWWLDYSKEILTVTEGQGHAGEDETSVMLYYDESLVQMDKALKNIHKPLIRMYFKDRGRIIYENAVSGDATLGTAKKGEDITNMMVDKIIEAIRIVKSGKYYTCD